MHVTNLMQAHYSNMQCLGCFRIYMHVTNLMQAHYSNMHCLGCFWCDVDPIAATFSLTLPMQSQQRQWWWSQPAFRHFLVRIVFPFSYVMSMHSLCRC